MCFFSALLRSIKRCVALRWALTQVVLLCAIATHKKCVPLFSKNHSIPIIDNVPLLLLLLVQLVPRSFTFNKYVCKSTLLPIMYVSLLCRPTCLKPTPFPRPINQTFYVPLALIKLVCNSCLNAYRLAKCINKASLLSHQPYV